jgi:hypothetical protein
LVAKDVADAARSLPIDARVKDIQIIAELIGGFADPLETALDCIS